jgi:ribonuclease P protein component
MDTKEPRASGQEFRVLDRPIQALRCARLRKHADYQRVYRESRKHSSASMTYFFAEREAHPAEGPRVGLTAGRVLGNSVERNRIKRRMREAVRFNLNALTRDVDVVLHPRRSVLTVDFAFLRGEVSKIFAMIEKAPNRGAGPRQGKP